MLYGCFLFKFVFYVYKNDFFKIFFCFVVAVSEQFHILEFSFSIIFFTNPKIIEFSFVACFLLVLGTLICFLRFYFLGTNLSFSTEGFYFYNFLFRSRFLYISMRIFFLSTYTASRSSFFFNQKNPSHPPSFCQSIGVWIYVWIYVCMYVWVCVWAYAFVSLLYICIAKSSCMCSC